MYNWCQLRGKKILKNKNKNAIMPAILCKFCMWQYCTNLYEYVNCVLEKCLFFIPEHC